MRTAAAVLILVLAGWIGSATGQENQARADVPQLPRMALAAAPEFPTGLQWLNTDRPLSLKALRGKVVLLDFWTYGCINCLHVLPDLRRLEATFADELVVIGVHSAKYDNEAVLANVRQAVQRYGITHPVVNDRDYRIWKAYRVPGWPTQIVIDPEGRLLQGFVGENHYERLERLIAATIDLHRHKGTLHEGPWQASAAVAQRHDTPLRYPGKVLADAESSRLFIADTNHHRIVVTDPQGNLLRLIGRGTPGADDGPLGVATFRYPQGMALLDGMLYVADTGNHLVRRVDVRHGMVDTVLGTGAKAREFNVPGTGRTVPLNSPWALYGHGPYLYIAMAGMHQLWRLHLGTGYAEPFSGSSQEGLLDDVHSNAALAQPSGLSGDGQRLYVADSEVNAIRVADLDPDGTLATVVGGGLFTFGDRDGMGAQARLQHPLGVAYADGLVYVADTYNHKIKRLDPRSGELRTLAGTGRAGYRDGPAERAQFYEPGGLSAAAGRLYVADTNNHRIRVIDVATRDVSTLTLSHLTPPSVGGQEQAPAGQVEHIRLREQTVRAASRASVRLALQLPTGWKINAAAPATLTVETEGRVLHVPTAYAKRTLRPPASEVRIPLRIASQEGQGHLQVELAFVACSAKAQGVCVLRQVRWDVPVRSRIQARQSEVLLSYTMPPL
jgi:DNA-binding beta-propeller fold protein YncE/peroxiredoxin